jgi:hypothetical protein
MTDEPKASQGTRSGSAAGRRYTVWRSNLLSDDCSEYDNPDTKALVVLSSDYDKLQSRLDAVQRAADAYHKLCEPGYIETTLLHHLPLGSGDDRPDYGYVTRTIRQWLSDVATSAEKEGE